jgi:5-oxoprolinase (ATP-hydrolysing)/N-methylhydantoinase A
MHIAATGNAGEIRRTPNGQRWRVGFDVGGTFTDFILYDVEIGRVTLHKRLTTPHDPSEAALQGLEELMAMSGIEFADVGQMVHGTTLVTNAIIERKGAKLGLITTEGFRDILEMGTEQRYDIYDLFLRFPQPLVSRDRRREVSERIDRDGQIVTPLNEKQLLSAIRRLSADGCEAIAVCFINSYRNSAHERAAGRVIREHFPTLSVSLSSEVVAEVGEYHRCVTACANAYVQPMMGQYLRRLQSELSARGFCGDFHLMHSAGGLVSPATARELPIRLLESGPAGGGLATSLFGALAGKKDVISFDMGGTTAKACMVENGRIEIAPMIEAGRVHRFIKGSGLSIKAPVIEMIEIGAGGGSIAVIDEVGLLKVGPGSAGSDPGPACYGMGGVEPTVTDANLVLGYYDARFFLGGRMQLDVEAARKAIRSVSEPLGLSVEQAAWGIHKVVTESMAAATRVHLVEKGKDPRRYSMVGFGGAGPAHAVDVARALGVRSVIIPPASGAASALGFLAAPQSFELVQSLPTVFKPGFDAAAVNRTLDQLEEVARRRLLTTGIEPHQITVERTCDMRLIGQLYVIPVVLPVGPIHQTSLASIRTAFEKAYADRYTVVFESAEIEAVTFRVRCVGPIPSLSLRGAAGGGERATLIKGKRPAWFADGFVEATVYDRYGLREGDGFWGPAVIEEREATTIVGPGDSFKVDANLNIVIQVGVAVTQQALVQASMSISDAMQRIESDPIALEIMWSRLITVVEEMWLTVCRTAFSLVISEAQDFACIMLDAGGEPLAHSPRAMPVFNLTLPLAVKAMLKRFPAESLRPGDVLITNDPWLCAGHLFDIAIVTPVFKNTVLVGLMGTVGHVSDIGGTKDALHAREIYEEGFQIPPMKLYSAGALNTTLFELLGENVRNREQVLGDVQSLVAANSLGAARLVSFMSDYGMEDLRALAAVVQNRSEKAMRAAISAIADGVYYSEISSSPNGTPLRFPLKLTVTGDAIELDFEGAPLQLAQGGVNATLNYTTAHATYPLKCMLTPNVRGNSGCFRPFTVRAPEGSVLNPRKPASVSLRTRTGWWIAPNVFRALASAVPSQVQAFTGLPMNFQVYGTDADGRVYSDMMFAGGGQGGSKRCDGKSGLLWPTSAANTSIELFEARVPVLILEKSYITDSGGAGRQRGGLGTRIKLRKLFDDTQEVLVSVYPQGVNNPVDGLDGGRPGGESYVHVVDASNAQPQDIAIGGLVSLCHIGQIVDFALAGGSGFGIPRQRPRALILEDIAQERITPAGAARDYSFQIDTIATVEVSDHLAGAKSN